MKTLPLLVLLMTAWVQYSWARPTFDVLANILHDIVHDPNEPYDHHHPHGQTYTNQGPYIEETVYNRPHKYSNGGQQYPYRQPVNRPSYNQGPANGYYTNNQYQGGAPSYGSGYDQGYGNQGYSQGPYYRQNSQGYNTNNGGSYGYQSPPPYNYRSSQGY